MKRDLGLSQALFWICLLDCKEFLHYFNYSIIQLLTEVIAFRDETVHEASGI